MLSISDIVALAKAGYKPGDVKELITLSKDEPKDEPKEEPKDIPKDEPKEEPKEDNIDYKKLYEDAIKANINKDLSINDKSDEDIIADLARSFM